MNFSHQSTASRDDSQMAMGLAQRAPGAIPVRARQETSCRIRVARLEERRAWWARKPRPSLCSGRATLVQISPSYSLTAPYCLGHQCLPVPRSGGLSDELARHGPLINAQKLGCIPRGCGRVASPSERGKLRDWGPGGRGSQMKTGTGSAISCTATQPVPLLLAVPVPVFITVAQAGFACQERGRCIAGRSSIPSGCRPGRATLQQRLPSTVHGTCWRCWCAQPDPVRRGGALYHQQRRRFRRSGTRACDLVSQRGNRAVPGSAPESYALALDSFLADPGGVCRTASRL